MAESLRLLSHHGADLSVIFPGGESWLHKAARLWDYPAVKLLINHGVPFAAKSEECETPLRLVCDRDFLHSNSSQFEKVAVLLAELTLSTSSARESIFWESNLHRVSLLELAIVECSILLVRLLLSNGQDPNARSSILGAFKETPLHTACSMLGGNEYIARELIEHGAYIDAKDERGCTPLCYSVQKDSEPTMKLLIDRGASPYCTAPKKCREGLPRVYEISKIP